MKLTPFGKLVRQFRIESEVTLAKMASDVGVSAAFASGVETGVKKIPPGYVTKVAEALELSSEEAAELNQAAELSLSEVKISLGRSVSRADREVVAMFARRFQNLPEDKKNNLRRLLEGGEE